MFLKQNYAEFISRRLFSAIFAVAPNLFCAEFIFAVAAKPICQAELFAVVVKQNYAVVVKHNCAVLFAVVVSGRIIFDVFEAELRRIYSVPIICCYFLKQLLYF